jgi:hypothetical protein
MKTAIITVALLVAPSLAQAQKAFVPRITPKQKIELKKLHDATPYLNRQQKYHRTFNLKTLARTGHLKMNRGERSVTVRVPQTHELRLRGYVPIWGHSGTTSGLESKPGKNNTRLYQLQAGDYGINHIGVDSKAYLLVRRDRQPTLQETLNMQRMAEIKALGDRATKYE